jgi:hypothetical protein
LLDVQNAMAGSPALRYTTIGPELDQGFCRLRGRDSNIGREVSPGSFTAADTVVCWHTGGGFAARADASDWHPPSWRSVVPDPGLFCSEPRIISGG